jgi:hypothetical protein
VKVGATQRKYRKESVMAIHSGRTGDGWLRLALRIDAVASGTMGLAFVAGAAVLDGVLGVPAAWLVGLGAFLVGYAGGLTWIAGRPHVPAAPAWTVIVGNVGWVLLSVAAVLFDWFDFSAVGVAVVLAQAAAVAAFADAQYVGLRRVRAGAARPVTAA